MKKIQTRRLKLDARTIRRLDRLDDVHGGFKTTAGTDGTNLCKSIDPNQGPCP